MTWSFEEPLVPPTVVCVAIAAAAAKLAALDLTESKSDIFTLPLEFAVWNLEFGLEFLSLSFES